MIDDQSIGLKFYHKDEYDPDEWVDSIYSIGGGNLPIPEIGDVVSFLVAVDEDGERQRTWNHQAPNRGEVTFEETEFYEVVDRNIQYHHNHASNDQGKFVIDRPEVSVTVLVTPYEGVFR